jgi:hypothetical protein
MDPGSTQPLTEMSNKGIFWGGGEWGGGVKAPGVLAENLATFMCRLSRNSGILKLQQA